MARVAIAAIRGYQKRLSSHTGATCLFSPSCSHRAVLSLEQHGFAEGVRMINAQLRRCGGDYALSTTTTGETWLITNDALRFGPGELSLNVKQAVPALPSRRR